MFLKPEVRAAKEAIGWEARAQYHGEPITKPLKVEIALYWPDHRKHDVDNIKGLLDALTGIVWQDDGQIVELRTRKCVGQDQPRVEMVITPVPRSPTR